MPVRLATRKTWVSTAIVGSPNAVLSTTLASCGRRPAGPRVGAKAAALRQRGAEQQARQRVQVLRLALARPMVEMWAASASPRSSASIARGVFATGKRRRRLVDAGVGGPCREHGLPAARRRWCIPLAGCGLARCSVAKKGSTSLVFMLGSGAVLAALRRARASAGLAITARLRSSTGRIGVPAVRAQVGESLASALAARRASLSHAACSRRTARRQPALAGALGLPRRPGRPAGARAAHVDQGDAVHRAGRNAQLAAGAPRADHRVHGLGAPTMQSTGQALMHMRCEPMHQASSITASCSGPSLPWAGSSARTAGRSCRQPRDAFAPPGGHYDAGLRPGDGARVVAQSGIRQRVHCVWAVRR